MLPPAPTGPLRAFTARLDPETHERFARVTRAAAAEGFAVTRPGGGGSRPRLYPVGQGDVLRALLVLADTRPEVAAALVDQLAADPAVTRRQDAQTS